MTKNVQIGRVSDIATFSTPPRVQLEHTRGDSFSCVFRLFREVDECGNGHSAQTLTGFTGSARLRAAPDHPLNYPFTVVVDTVAGSGRVTISATAEETRLWPETGVWDLELTDGASVRKTIVRGTWKMRRDASY